MADWLKSKRLEKDGHFFWKDRISFEEEIGEVSRDDVNLTRDSWCYGTPSIARTLYNSARLLNDKALMDFAENLSFNFH